MNAIKAIFIKQLHDLPRNISVSLIYIMFPVMAFLFGQLMGDMDLHAAMFASIFAGTTPLIAICMTVAEDREYKSLRFLVMAGVKPSQYLIGLSSFVLLMSSLPMVVFIWMGGFTDIYLAYFIGAAFLALVASCILGAAIGIFAKNIQQATAIYTPIMMLLMMLPMIAGANETLARIAELTFSFQVLIVSVSPEYADIPRAFMIIGINIVVLLAFFIFAYRKKGLRG